MNQINPLQNAAFRKVVPRKSYILKIGIVLLFIISLLNVVSAQTATTGQISGNITDASGAAVPDATITVTRAETGEARTVTTSEDGNYTVPNLAIGTYRITVSKTGFKETTVGSVVVNVANITRQDVALEIGQVTETVQITADAIQVETQTGTVGEVITGEQVRELPLNGRNFVQLTQLQPGVAAANNQDTKSKGLFGGVDFSVNGNSAQSNLFLTDGANNNDTGSNRTILLFPSIEAIAEFKSLRNSYGPEYGQAAGAVISIVTRGGTNEFHGSLFYFGRNDALNATEYFANRDALGKNSLRRHDYGFSVGGPLPFFNFGEGGPMFRSGKDRLFFFYSQEWNKEIRGQSRFGSVPTLLERQGNFSQPRFASNGQRCSPDPIQNASHPGFATQIIPQASLSRAGLALVKLLPLPNVSNPNGCNNWAQSANSPIDFREENIRIDSNLNSKNKIFGRYTQDHWSNATPILTGNLWGDDAFPTVESSWTQPSRQAAVKLTTQLGSTAVNEVQFSYSANRINVT
ncbi:MAG TPA: carboxypeptidase regulatory-like domain-containing protein, partial [Pyrinomonadaceae bacterium]